ncbi:MAG: type I-E CRISPR-associated protein Cas7/Cse4/CasC [Coriobacteriia bacterium]|nr:type I-E CRISPR-associated protein Cas7/Cse4/CasC [Coriobacteriia bacterium]
MSRTIVDIHVLQTVPPSNLNRDDTGSPKTATYGGVRRARVSSQAWKRAIRTAFASGLGQSELGVRTKRVVEVLAERIRDRAPELADRAEELAKATVNVAGIKTTASSKGNAEESSYLVFLSSRQYDNLAAAAVIAADQVDVNAALKAQDVKTLANRDHSVDVALFGRMVADISDINVDAAVQVAHAISVHGVENEYDYFTAVDDRKQESDETGAGMIGTVEFNSATLYRYGTLDVDALMTSLGDATATRRAAEAFVRAFVTSMPTGKMNTFANRTLPDAVVVQLRDTQSVNFVGAFEEPVVADSTSGRVPLASKKLAGYATQIEDKYAQRPLASWVVRVGDATDALSALGSDVSLPELIENVGDQISTRIGEIPRLGETA